MSAKILKYLESVEQATYADMAKALQIEDPKTLSPIVRALVDLDLVEVLGNTGGTKGNSKIFKLLTKK